MKRETLVVKPEKQKRRIGILPTYAQRDRTKYDRKTKHRNHNSMEQRGKRFTMEIAFRAVSPHYAGLAQTGEQLLRKHHVAGSIPASGSKYAPTKKENNHAAL